MKCCERDHNNDGNCDIHSEPGVLRYGGATAGILAEKQMVERLVKAGWTEADAKKEYDAMLRDAAEEDGMD